jgi:hypothetical protein
MVSVKLAALSLLALGEPIPSPLTVAQARAHLARQACKDTEALCAGECVDPATSSAHCGACGNTVSPPRSQLIQCAGTETCANGTCTACPDGRTSCPYPTWSDRHLCFNLSTSLENCGVCGIACIDFAAGQRCIGGKCVCGGQDAHKISCGDSAQSCHDPMTSVRHCGRCDNACGDGERCVQGECQRCPADQIRCGDECVPYSEMHCGGCGEMCPHGEWCDVSGPPRCVPCPQGQTGCDGRCVNVLNDNSNCGRCWNTCRAGSNCVDGRCSDQVPQCAAPQEQCGDDCVNPQNDNRHCGGCDVLCPAGKNCVDGQCV